MAHYVYEVYADREVVEALGEVSDAFIDDDAVTYVEFDTPAHETCEMLRIYAED